MRLCKLTDAKGRSRVGVLDDANVRLLPESAGSLSQLLFAEDPGSAVQKALASASESVELAKASLLPPIDQQEVWAAGVTYMRSKVARMEESDSAATFYDKVYSADRPELFFKATPSRVVGFGKPVRIRKDTRWSVPEPEVTLAIDPRGRIVGYTIGNDMSARDIEGENPLYLPQAKVYNQCAGLGPCVTLASAMPPLNDVAIVLRIERDGKEAFRGETSIARMNRKFPDLVAWLIRDNDVPAGAFLMTGTGIVPPDDFSLRAGDLVHITIDGIGTLTNPVVQGP
jgi:2-dehydro-3-deoxy-D-arabinonate dehydratase